MDAEPRDESPAEPELDVCLVSKHGTHCFDWDDGPYGRRCRFCGLFFDDYVKPFLEVPDDV
jgi:hypothetical protein